MHILKPQIAHQAHVFEQQGDDLKLLFFLYIMVLCCYHIQVSMTVIGHYGWEWISDSLGWDKY